MSEVPGWTFTLTEESAGHYCVRGQGPRGMTVERQSSDPDEALAAAPSDAADLDGRLQA